MNTYFVTLISVCAVAAIAGTVAPTGRQGKYIDLILSLLILLVLLSPLVSLGDSLPSLPDLEEEEVFPEASPIWEATEVSLREAVVQAFGFERGWVVISVTGEIREGAADITKVEVTLTEEAKKQSEAVRRYLLAQIRGECEVVVHVG